MCLGTAVSASWTAPSSGKRGTWKEMTKGGSAVEGEENAQMLGDPRGRQGSDSWDEGDDPQSILCWSCLPLVYISSQLPFSDFVGCLKLAIVGVFTPQKSANAPDQGFLTWRSCC